jgi:hypothetical protein
LLTLLQLLNHTYEGKENNQGKIKTPEQAILIKLMGDVIEQIVKQLKKKLLKLNWTNNE